MDFNAKMHQIWFRLGLCPGPRWESLQRSPSPRAPSLILRGLLLRGGRGGEGKGKGMKDKEGMSVFFPEPTWQPYLRVLPLSINGSMHLESVPPNSETYSHHRHKLVGVAKCWAETGRNNHAMYLYNNILFANVQNRKQQKRSTMTGCQKSKNLI